MIEWQISQVQVTASIKWSVGSQRVLGQRGLRQRSLPFWPEPKGPGPKEYEPKGPGSKGPESKGPMSIHWTDHVPTKSRLGTLEHQFNPLDRSRPEEVRNRYIRTAIRLG